MRVCPFCAEEIQDAAILCKHCGSDLAKGTPAPKHGGATTVAIENESKLNAGVAAVLSLVIPGAGQMYCGRVGQGLAMLAFVALGYALFIVPGLILHALCISGAYSLATKINRGQPPPISSASPPQSASPVSSSSDFTLRQKIALAVMAIGIVAYAVSRSTEPTVSKPTISKAIAPVVRSSYVNRASDLLAGYEEARRGASLRDTVISSGGKCDRAARTFFKGSDSNAVAYWAVGCVNGLNYLIQIKPNETGSTTVTDCSTYRKVSNGDCFAQF